MTRLSHLPAYTDETVRSRLLDAGASGTIYALVMPESEDAYDQVVDGMPLDKACLHQASEDACDLLRSSRQKIFDRYREPWTRKQDAMHVEWFDRWIEWSSPVIDFDPSAFPHRYPTAGASEGIYKLMAEAAAVDRANGLRPEIHVFEGEYEGFVAFAESLRLTVIRHPRDQWLSAANIKGSGQFWISQPSAIDGMVWEHFDEFARHLSRTSPQIELVPDLSYVGAVARDYRINLRHPAIRSFVVSQSKPFGGYYHRVGGAFSKKPVGALVGNMWFKNLQSLAWGCEVMKSNDVHALPKRYRGVQTQAAHAIGRRLGLDSLEPADVMVMGIAPVQKEDDPIISTLIRGSKAERLVRLCLTPDMSVRIDRTLHGRRLTPEMGSRIGHDL